MNPDTNNYEDIGELCVELEHQNGQLANEVARLNNTLENTRISRATIIEDRNLLDQELAASNNEVARLRSQLARSVEIAETACKYLDTGGWNEDEMYSGKDGWVTETEINEVCVALAALKSKIK
jgi:dynactin complex subunit